MARRVLITKKNIEDLERAITSLHGKPGLFPDGWNLDAAILETNKDWVVSFAVHIINRAAKAKAMKLVHEKVHRAVSQATHGPAEVEEGLA